MARPWKHPKTGIYWLRRIVPERLRMLVGKREEKRSLGTRDPEEARRLHAKAIVELDARWANLRSGETSLTEREAHALAKPLLAQWLALHEDDPSNQLTWHPNLYDQLVLTRSYDPADDEVLEDEGSEIVRGRPLDAIVLEGMRRFALAQARYVLDAHGLTVDIYSHLKLAKACAIALQRASILLAQAAETGEPVVFADMTEMGGEGRVSLLPVSARAPNGDSLGATRSQPGSHRGSDPGPTLSGLLESWWGEAKAAGLKPSTYESYSHAVNAFVAFLGHDDAMNVTGHDVVAFKNHRLTTASKRTGRLPTAKTVKDSDLAGLKTVFGWAVRNQKLKSNPAADFTIKITKAPRLRSKGFTDDEARIILSAALNHKLGGEAPKTWAAKRWVPWLCAFTGARVGELAQLRKEDVTRRDGLWVLRITPEAGTVKTNQAREIVLHAQIIELGFDMFVERASAGHLFLTPRQDGDVLKPLQTLKNRLAEFGRESVSDAGVAPNHGWRHRFKTVGMEVGVAPRILDAIQGHAPRSVADDYGDVTLKTMAEAIGKLPYYDIG